MVEGSTEGFLKLSRVLHITTEDSASIGDLGEVRVHQVCTETDNPSSLHFELNETQRIVLIDNHFHRRFELAQGEQLSHQHRKSAVARK